MIRASQGFIGELRGGCKAEMGITTGWGGGTGPRRGPGGGVYIGGSSAPLIQHCRLRVRSAAHQHNGGILSILLRAGKHQITVLWKMRPSPGDGIVHGLQVVRQHEAVQRLVLALCAGCRSKWERAGGQAGTRKVGSRWWGAWVSRAMAALCTGIARPTCFINCTCMNATVLLLRCVADSGKASEALTPGTCCTRVPHARGDARKAPHLL